MHIGQFSPLRNNDLVEAGGSWTLARWIYVIGAWHVIQALIWIFRHSTMESAFSKLQGKEKLTMRIYIWDSNKNKHFTTSLQVETEADCLV